MYCVLTEMGDYLIKHGDAVKDIAFTVEDCRALFKVSKLCTKLLWQNNICAYGMYVRMYVLHCDCRGLIFYTRHLATDLA